MKRVRAVVIIALLSVSCTQQGGGKREPVLARAFAGPVKLELRSEIHPKSKVVTSAQHGETIEVLQIRRRFVRVRTPRGDEGWTEVRNLLGPEQMNALQALASRADKLPSQGKATVYSPLNIHAEPSRTATSFYRVVEGVKVDVVGHVLVPRSNAPQTPAFQIPKPAPPVRKKREKKQPQIPPPPKPAAPGLPSNWRELSKTDLPEPPQEVLIAQAPPPQKKVPLEDWSLVRTAEGKAGWVSTRNLVMAIPDEVAQYSEGARITSYFSLGDVQDGDQMKHHWIWTTMSNPGEPYDFDSFRVFIYMLRRHRYETSYIERRVEGFYPITVDRTTLPRFALILRDETGKLVKRTYQLEGYLTRKVAEEPYEMKSGTPGATLAGKPEKEERSGEDESLLDRLKGALGSAGK
ncbi:MAG: SH3 domain-containing protein [Bryobacteraceae bacterium]|nr:SH3 domain-containing protein [Bryobacteraceae bacterium]